MKYIKTGGNEKGRNTWSQTGNICSHGKNQTDFCYPYLLWALTFTDSGPFTKKTAKQRLQLPCIAISLQGTQQKAGLSGLSLDTIYTIFALEEENQMLKGKN